MQAILTASALSLGCGIEVDDLIRTNAKQISVGFVNLCENQGSSALCFLGNPFGHSRFGTRTWLHRKRVFQWFPGERGRGLFHFSIATKQKPYQTLF